MTKEKMRNVCKRELIFPDFLRTYEKQLSALKSNAGFLSALTGCQGQVTPEVEFCLDRKNEAFARFKESVSRCLYEKEAYRTYADLRDIVDDVQKRGTAAKREEYTKASAYISVYYAMRFYKLSES